MPPGISQPYYGPTHFSPVSTGDLQCQRADYSDPHATYFHCARSSTETALEDIGIHFMNYGDHLRAYADPYFGLDVPDLDIFVDVDLIVDDDERCDTARIYWGTGDSETICDLAFRSHTTVQRVSLQTPQGNLRCERDDFSDAIFTSSPVPGRNRYSGGTPCQCLRHPPSLTTTHKTASFGVFP